MVPRKNLNLSSFVGMEGFCCLQAKGEKDAEMKDVSFNYGSGVPVLESVNVQIGEGEFIGLGGRNGCGKTTVTRLLAGARKARIR